MVISNKNQVAFIIFISSLTALLPGKSNNPLALLPCLLTLLLRFSANKPYKNISNNLFIYWYIYFIIFFILSLLNFILLGNSFNIVQSLILSITYVIYIFTFYQFDYKDLRDGVIKGSVPLLGFMLFIELPLRIINPDILLNIREILFLRPLVQNTLLGFFEEASQVPSLNILLITSFACLFIDNDFKKLGKNLKYLYILFLLIIISHISGSFIVCFYLPLFTYIATIYIKNLIINFKIKKFEKKLLIILLFIFIFISFYIPYIIRKITYSLDLDHSTSSRFLSLFSGINDLIQNPLLGVGAGFHRFTRVESMNQLINFISDENLKSILQNMYYISGIGSYNHELGFPVYSLVGYLFSETGLFAFIFIISYFFLIKKGFVYQNNLTNYKFSYVNLMNLIIGITPLSYFIYLLYGYPRALPYFIVANILVMKKFTNKTAKS